MQPQLCPRRTAGPQRHRLGTRPSPVLRPSPIVSLLQPRSFLHRGDGQPCTKRLAAVPTGLLGGADPFVLLGWDCSKPSAGLLPMTQVRLAGHCYAAACPAIVKHSYWLCSSADLVLSIWQPLALSAKAQHVWSTQGQQSIVPRGCHLSKHGSYKQSTNHCKTNHCTTLVTRRGCEYFMSAY